MAAIDENVLIANGVVRSQGNQLHCALCPKELDSDNWKAHIDNPSHIDFLQQFNLAFIVNGDKINCKACKMIFDWETLRNHAIWHKIIPWYVNVHRDKIFFENRSPETINEPVTNNTKEFPSDGNSKFPSASNCEIRGKTIDPKTNASTKSSSNGNSVDEPVELDDRTKNGSLKAEDSQSLRPYDCLEASSSKRIKIAENLWSSLSINLIVDSERKRRVPKTSSQKESSIINDHDGDYIHDMRDKLREIKRGFKLCMITDSNGTYCLICRTEVVGTVNNYHEHLRTLQHCKFLESMEKNHAAFENVPGQYSELDLAFEYMVDTTEDVICCTSCKIDMKNDDVLLRDHMNDKVHRVNVIEMHDKVKHAIDVQSRVKCDWYNILNYLCVPCNMNFKCDIKFDKHLKSGEHSKVLKKSGNTDRKFIFDFCSPCASLAARRFYMAQPSAHHTVTNELSRAYGHFLNLSRSKRLQS